MNASLCRLFSRATRDGEFERVRFNWFRSPQLRPTTHRHTQTLCVSVCLCVYVCVCVCRSEKRTVTLVAVDVIERTLREWVLSWWRSAGAQLDKQTAGQRNSRHTHTHTQRKKKRIKERNQKSKINSTCWFELNTTINQSNGVHGVRLSAK